MHFVVTQLVVVLLNLRYTNCIKYISERTNSTTNDSCPFRNEATRWRTRISINGQATDFSLLHSVKTGCGTHPASYPIHTGGASSGIKRFKREAATQSPYSAEIKNETAEMSSHNMSREAVHQHIGLMSTYRVASKFQNLECGLLDNTVQSGTCSPTLSEYLPPSSGERLWQ